MTLEKYKLAMNWFKSKERFDIIGKLVKNVQSNTKIIKRNLIVDLLYLFKNDLLDQIYLIPELGSSNFVGSRFFSNPSNHGKDDAQLRCCIYKEKEVISHRLLSTLGYNVDDKPRLKYHTDSLKELSKISISTRKKLKEPFFSVSDAACERCSSGVFVNNCHRCIGKYCIESCGFKAIEIMRGGSVRIDENKCRKCKQCISVCPFNSIQFEEVPCIASCPVGALSRKDDTSVIEVDRSKCIMCGKCLVACPFGAIMQKCEFLKIASILKERLQIREENQSKNKMNEMFKIKEKEDKKSKKKNEEKEWPIIALLAPSIIGQFKSKNINQIAEAFIEVGFDNIAEVAKGADYVSLKEANEMKEKVFEGDKNFMTSSCCWSYMLLVDKHIPELKGNKSTTETPLNYTARLIKEKYNGKVRTVFISPCLAKRDEVCHDPYVDYVLTIEEVTAILKMSSINTSQCEPKKDIVLGQSSSIGRGFPVSGGVANAVKTVVEELGYGNINPYLIDGIKDKKDVKKLKKMGKNGKVDPKNSKNFVEIMACKNGCYGGPETAFSAKKTKKHLLKFIEKSEKINIPDLLKKKKKKKKKE